MTKLIKTYDEWPSATDKPFQPQFDQATRQLAVRGAPAALSVGPNSLGSLVGYVGAHTAAGIPKRQPADLSGLAKDKPRPTDMAGLLRALLGPGNRNKGLVLGDSNHFQEGIHEILADSKVIDTLKELGVTHIMLEVTPEALKGLRDPEGHLHDRAGFPGRPLLKYFHYRFMPMERIVRLCDAAGIAVVPMDIMGPAATKLFNSTPGRSLQRETNSQRRQKILQEWAKTEGKLKEDVVLERVRVTDQVWVPRIEGAMREKPNGKFLVLAGDLHVINPVFLGNPDIFHADLDERLAKTFAAPVPYIRVRQENTRYLSIAEPKKAQPEGYEHWGRDMPELILKVPSRQRQEVERAASALDKPDRLPLQAAERLEKYDEQMRQFVTAHANVLELLGREPSRQDLDAVDALLEGRQIMLMERKGQMLDVLKPVNAITETLALVGAGSPNADQVRKEIGKMRAAMEGLHGQGDSTQEPLKGKATREGMEKRLPLPAPRPRSKQKDSGHDVT